jgi:hypothetical protein
LNDRVSSTTTVGSTTIQSIFVQTIVGVLKEEDDFNKDQEQLKIDRQKFGEEKKQTENLVKNTDVIRLNVGGQLIMTIRETLTQVPKSILAIMFNGRWQHKLPIDQKGNIFLDFDPILFRHLLDQLQIFEKNNPVRFHPPLIPTLVKPFNKMLRKLGLSPSLSSEENVITLNVGGLTITNRRKTFTQLSNSRFFTNFSSDNTTKFDNNSYLFLDYDPKLFQYLISHQRKESPQNLPPLTVPSYKEHNALKEKLLNLAVTRK